MKVYIVQSTKNLVVYGCFETYEKASKFTHGDPEFHIIESSVL